MADHASQHADGAGPYGLGMMPSMSQECTPLKHRYDACFNRWFEDYLGVGHLAQASASGSRSGAVSGESSRSNGLGGLFGRGSSSSSSSSSSVESISSASTASTQATSHSGAGPIQRSPEEQRRLRDRLDGECGAMWKEYQQCVLRAVKDRDLEGPIAEARAHNPFPFPSDIPKGKPNNDPFPFPAGPGGR